MFPFTVSAVKPFSGHNELDVGEDEQTQLVPFNLRPPTKSHSTMWSQVDIFELGQRRIATCSVSCLQPRADKLFL